MTSGGASVNYHMLNEESRKYFNRAFVMSSTALNSYAFRKANHVQHLQEYSKTCKMNDLIEYLKKTNATVLNKSYRFDYFGNVVHPTYVPTIENPNAIGAFMTKTPEELYRSDSAPIMDAMFSFTSQVTTWFLIFT